MSNDRAVKISDMTYVKDKLSGGRGGAPLAKTRAKTACHYKHVPFWQSGNRTAKDDR
jgi:hypothetical protein